MRDERQHLAQRAEAYFHEPVAGPNDSFSPPGRFFKEVLRIANSNPPVPTGSPIVFMNNNEAAKANGEVLALCGYDLQRLIDRHPDSTLGYGSEFRTVEQLEPLLGRHPHFEKLSQVLKFGMSYVFSSEMDAITKSTELEKILQRGNHKSAQESPSRVTELLAKDVKHGFVIPIPTEIITSIPGAAVQPLGLARQWTIDEEGNRLEKFRLTQDLSFSSSRSGPQVSINSRIDMTAYTEMIYGWCLPRILHYIVALRLKFPSKIIFICKYDYSDAYRRVAHSASAAVQTISVHDGRAYLSVRLTFGGRPNPPTWCTFSEVATDLSNEISQCGEWDPSTLHSPAQPSAPEPQRLPSNLAVEPGRKMAVSIPIDENRPGRVDDFIDDLINVFVDTPVNCKLQPHVVPLAIHITSRPHAGDDKEPIIRRPLLSPAKRDSNRPGMEDQHSQTHDKPARRQVLSLERRLGKSAGKEILSLPGTGRTGWAPEPYVVRPSGYSPLPQQDSRGAVTPPAQKTRHPPCTRSDGGLQAVERNPNPSPRGSIVKPDSNPRTGQDMLVGCMPLWTRRLQHIGTGLEATTTTGTPPPGASRD